MLWIFISDELTIGRNHFFFHGGLTLMLLYVEITTKTGWKNKNKKEIP